MQRERGRERNTDSNKGLRSEPAGSGSLKEVGKDGRAPYTEDTINRQRDLATFVFFMLFAFGNNFESSTGKEKNKDNAVISLFHVSPNQQHRVVWGRDQVMCMVAFVEVK